MSKMPALTLCLVLTIVSASGQTATITGVVTNDENRSSIPGITVVVSGTYYGGVTDAQGSYLIDNITPGTYHLIVSGIGYVAQTIQVSLKSDQKLKIDIRLVESVTEMEEIVVMGKSQATEMREQAYAVEVVESKGFKNLSTNANDILGRISGVNIRQAGGLGSDFSLSLNGLTGNQVRIFLDGVPMDYFGSSLSLNNFSANIIDRIEVYKGVVPIHLSSDALGGAINVSTGQQYTSYLDASYSIGSFNTHIGSLNAQYRSSESGFTVRTKAFYNSSDNNYVIPVKLLTNSVEDDFFTNVERFHDGYKSQMAWVETGFTGTTFADQLFIGFLYSDNYNEIQQPTYLGLPKFPYGEVTQEEEKFIVNFSYNKHGLLDGRLNINSYAVGVFSEEINRDTSSYQYDWFGNRELRTSPNRGEIEGRKTFLILDTENYLGNFNAEYLLSEHHNVAVNYSLNHLILQGSDEFRAQNNTQFSTPNKLTKQVVGLSYTLSLMDGKFKNTVFTKGYAYDINSLETNFQGTETTPFNESKTNLGFGFSSTYQFNKVQVKASYENAIRFPEVIEIFGDGLNNIPNPALQPEKSKNYNLGAIFSFDSSNPFMLSVNGFVRDTEDFIIPVAQGPRAVRINQGKKLSTGLDLNINYQFKKNLIFNVNGTYLDLRDNNKPEEGQISLQYRQRVPNVPYLFGSSSLSYRLDFKNKSALSATVIQNYVHSFFLFWENVGSQDRRTVPDQWSTNLDLVYTLQDGRYNFSIGASNLWDAQLYDNYEQQRPGRAYSFKFRYFIH